MLDNIVYEDIDGLILDIEISSVGQSDKILYKDISGFMENIDQINSGESSHILYRNEIMEVLTLICDNTKTYSRSRVVNT